MTQPNKQILAYAYAVLARRRMTVHEIRQKLHKRFPDFPEESEEIIKKFLALHYLDDAEYIQLFIKNQLLRKPQGIRSIKQKLQLKGLSKELIEKNLKACTDADAPAVNELELAKQAATKKLRTLKANSPLQQKQKIFRFLSSRGFNQDTIFRALKSLKSLNDYSSDLPEDLE